MIDFDRAIAVARENITKLVNGAQNITLEGALISQDEKLYEVTYSYDLDRTPPKTTTFGTSSPNMLALAGLLGMRREYKVFLVDAESGKFRGFKKYKEE